MMLCHDVTKPDLPISACRCARKLILFLFPWFCRSLISKILMISHSYDVVTSCRHVMTSQKLFNLSQVMNSPGTRIVFRIPWFFWLLILKLLVFMYSWDDIMS